MKRTVATLAALAGLLLAPVRAAAQPTSKLFSMSASGTITANGGSVEMQNTGGLGSLKVQSSGTYTGTWEVQCSVAPTGITPVYDADDEVNLSLEGASSAAVQSVTDSVAIWTASIAGCTAVKVIATSSMTGSLVIYMYATTTGGGSSSGGSSAAGTVDPTTATAWGIRAEDVAHTTADPGVQILGVRRDADTTLVDTTGDYAPFQLNAGGQLKVACIAGCSGSTFADNAAFTFGTTVISPIGGVFDDVGSNTATENSAAVARITTNKALHVNLRTAAGVEITPATDATHDSTASTTGPQVVGEATSALTSDTAVADGDAARFKVDLLGRLITTPGCGKQDRVRGYVAITDGSSTSVLAAQGANIIAEIYTIIIANSSATDVTVDMRDGTAGSVLTTLMAPATSDTGGGGVYNLNSPILFTANTAVAADPSASASTIYVTVLGCKVL